MEILCHNPINNDANRAVGYPGDAKKKGVRGGTTYSVLPLFRVRTSHF